MAVSGLPAPLIQTGNKPVITTMDRMEPAASHHHPYLRTVRVTVGEEARVLSACLNQYGGHLTSPHHHQLSPVIISHLLLLHQGPPLLSSVAVPGSQGLICFSNISLQTALLLPPPPSPPLWSVIAKTTKFHICKAAAWLWSRLVNKLESRLEV